jgi:hypothetical protein
MRSFSTLLFGLAFLASAAHVSGFNQLRRRGAFEARDNSVNVNLRIEGATNTIFEGPIVTQAERVATPSGGNHTCDGTNLGANPTPGGTCTTALNDAAHQEGFTFDGCVPSHWFYPFRLLPASWLLLAHPVPFFPF